MRWPWTRDPAGPPAPVPPVVAPAGVAADPPPSPMGWAFLPPIQRTLDTPITSVTRPTAFPAELPAWRSPAFTSTLSHAVVDTVPGGVVDGDGAGLGEPTHTVGQAPELTLLPPPRPTALQRSVTAQAPAEEQPAAPATTAEAVEPGEPDVVRPEVPAPTLTRAPSVGMPVLHRSVVSEPPALEPSEPSEPSAPVADLAPDDLPDRSPLGPTPAAPEVSPSPGPGEVGRPAVVQRSVATPLAPGPLPVQRATPTDASAPPSRPRPGLGAPLPTTPATALPTPPESYDDRAAPVVLEPAGSPSPAAAAETGFTEVPIQRVLAPSAPSSPRPASTGAKVAPPVDLPPTELTLVRSVDPAAEHSPPSLSVPDPAPADVSSVEEVAQPSVARPPAEDRAADELTDVPSVEEAAPATVTRPPAEDPAAEQPAPPLGSATEPPAALLPSAPLPLAGGIATSIQRADLLPGPGNPTPSLVVRPAPLVPTKPTRERAVPIQRLAIESAHLTPKMTPTRLKIRRADSTSTPQPGPVQRSATPHPLARPNLPDVATPLDDFSNVALPDVGTVTSPPSIPRPSEVTSAPPGPVVSRSVGLAPARTAPPETSPTMVSRSTPATVLPTMPLAAPPAVPVSVQAAAEDEPIEAAGSESAARPDPTEGTGSSPAGGGAVTVQTAAAPAAASAAPAAAPGKAGESATGDVDALAQKLFPAVLRRIKAELLLDRERRGVRTDPW